MKKAAKNKAQTSTAPAKVVSKTHWPVHPIALLFPAKPPVERAEMKEDMLKRADAGLDPLEKAIIMYEGQILDGRHRDELWGELAEEGASGGYFKNIVPPTETFSPKKDGNLAAWMRAKSSNMVVRQIPADQRGAIFLKAIETYPELKAVLDQIKEENLQRQKEGKPLAASGQRGNTAKQIAELAGVGTTTIKEAKQLQEADPDAFAAVVAGETTTKKALKKIKAKKNKKAASTSTDGNSAKDDRPKIADLLGILHRGLVAAEEAEGLDLKSTAVFFKVSGYRVKVTCQIV